MYMTGTDGAVVSSYAFDDFGRNIDPFTGNIRSNNLKHAYTKQGNIIQPFAFTGYQEDEVSGLKFAQARYYSADNGRFVGEDQFPGLLTSASTLNKFLYCENSPIDFVDNNGKWLKLKDFDINDGLGVAAVTVGAVAATVGAIGVGIALTATAPISLPVLACCGAAVGAGIACDASIISDWKKGEHANLIKAAGNTLAGAMIGGAVASGVGAVVSGGVTTLGTVSTAILEHKDILTSTIGGTISAIKGDSFSSGFFSTYINCKVTGKFGGFSGNVLGGISGSATGDIINGIEKNEKIDPGKLIPKALLTGVAQGVIGTIGDVYTKAFMSGDPSASQQLVWNLVNDQKNLGFLSGAAEMIIDHVVNRLNKCEG